MTRRPIDDPLGTVAMLALRWSMIGRYVWPAMRPATLLTLSFLGAALVPVSFVTNGPSLCPFKMLTGLPCPGCGMTRSVVTLLHGDLGASLFYHPLGIVIVALCFALVLADGWAWWRETRTVPAPSSTASLMSHLMLTPAPWLALVVLTVVWFVRLPLYVAGIWVF